MTLGKVLQNKIISSVKPSGKIFSSLDFFEVINFPLAQKPPSPSNRSPAFKSFLTWAATTAF